MRKCAYVSFILFALTPIWAQTNESPTKPTEATTTQQSVGLSAKYFVYSGNKQKVIYYGDVLVTNEQGILSCQRLTIDLPAEGSISSQPTNAVAETNVVIDFVKKGDTNHITCDKAVYTFLVVNETTNDTITFYGSAGHPAKVENSKGWMTGEPLVYDNVNGNFSGVDTETHFNMSAASGAGTNANSGGVPLNFLK